MSQWHRQVICCGLFIISSVVMVSCTTNQQAGNSTTAFNSPPPPAFFSQDLVPIRIGAPLYPLRAKNLLVEGWALVNFSVDVTGNVVQNSIEVVDSDPAGFFERSSIIATRAFTFENNSDFVLNDVSYVFRYELEELRSSGAGLSASQPLVRDVVPRRFITPAYPDTAARQGIGGYVVVTFSVSTAGQVSDIVITESQPAGVFDQAALDAAQRLLFEPRLIDGEPVAAENIEYRFDWNPNRLPAALDR